MTKNVKKYKISLVNKKDLEFSRRTEEAWRRHDKGDFKRMEFNDFIKEFKKW